MFRKHIYFISKSANIISVIFINSCLLFYYLQYKSPILFHKCAQIFYFVRQILRFKKVNFIFATTQYTFTK
jgi:hypothetical protein